VFVGSSTNGFADERDAFKRGQEHFRLEQWIERRADGSLSKQIEKPLAQEDGLLGGDFFYSGWCQTVGLSPISYLTL
jgi:hypothetical protein